MRMLAVAFAAGLMAVNGAAARPDSTHERERARGPFLLVSLASLGTVTWRCDPARRPGLGLGFEAFASSADASTTLIVGKRTTRTAHVAPGGHVDYPYLRAPVQKLEIVQGTEAGTLRATITVDFAARSGPSHCWRYAPPRTTVSMSARH